MNKRALILIVDDVPTNIHVLMAGLTADYDVKIATNGNTAIELAELEEKPDLILLDVMMPEMDGYEVCRRLKANRATADIPIIFVTALSETGQEEFGFSLGAADYITKPFELSIVRARVKNHLELKFRQDELTKMNEELNKALAKVKLLSGFLPICASCKKIRNDQGYWQQIESYIHEHSEAEFSHGICPDCIKKLYPDYLDILDQA